MTGKLFDWLINRGPVSSVSEMQCVDCREVVKVPPGFFEDWDELLSGKCPEHDCTGPAYLRYKAAE